ncbi:MAG TPA: hypothetical protein VH475_20780 [Tepidisphaeraceae bacterium]|jgi:hypothetical protein
MPTKAFEAQPIGDPRRVKLTAQQREKLRVIHEALADVDRFSFDQRMDAFERHLDAERDLPFLEQLADSYRKAVESHEGSPTSRIAALRMMLFWAMGLRALQFVNPAIISDDGLEPTQQRN